MSTPRIPWYPLDHGKHALRVWGTIFCLGLGALIATYLLFVEAPPPTTIVIATGDKDGAYHKFAEKYAAELANEGLTLELHTTNGSVENLELLKDKTSGVSIAIVQSGVVPAAELNRYEALGSLFREPLWVFYRDPLPERGKVMFKSLADMVNGPEPLRRFGIGPPGSGTQKIARQFLADNGIEASPDKIELIEDPVAIAAVKLQKHELDAAFIVAGFDATYVQTLLKDEKIELLSFGQHEAYHRKYRFLSDVTIPAGLVDLRKNLPNKDVHLLAPTAMLVARKDLHPAIVTLLLTTATRLLSRGNELSSPGEFPSPLFTDVPIAENAAHFYKYGPPMLQRMLPFWLASLADRLKVMLIPLVMLLMPLFRAAPPLVRWRTRRKIYLWYAVLRDVDKKLGNGLAEPALSMEIARLRDIEMQVAHVKVPLSYMEELYHLRLHLTMMRETLEKRHQAETEA